MPGSIFSAKIDPACFPQASGRPALRGTNLAPWAVDRPNAIRPAESGAASGQKQQQMDSRRGKNMIKGLYRSAAGMIPLPYNQDLVTNNLANNNSHSARLYGKGVVGAATRVYSVLLEVGADSLVHVQPASWRTELNE